MEKKKENKRKLAAILFCDIEGYTSLMQTNEQLALSSLQKFKTQLDTQVPQHHGEIINFYGDGCLAIFNSSVDATACAKSLQTIFQSEPKVPVRIGLHAGDVVLRDDNVFGDAVNIASRIESMGVPGSVLLSSTVQNQIHNQSTFDVSLIGKFEFKNINKPMSVYALKGEGLIVPEKAKLKGKQKTSSWSPMPKGFWIPIVLFTVISFGVALLSGLKNKAKADQQVQTVEIANEKSIAVLPFKNFSGNDSLEFFCDGMTDEVISRLNNITALDKVISRTTVFKYKDSNKTIPEIANELGVNHILESSFQKAGDQMRIKFNLVEVKTEHSIWEDEITGVWNSDDVFTIQKRVAENVANNMNLNLSSAEVVAIQEPPTDNKEAYDLFMLAEYQRYKHNKDSYKEAMKLYEQALIFDAEFAKAYEGLGYVWLNGGLIWGLFSEEEAVEKASLYLRKALSIRPSNFTKFSLVAVEFYYKWNFDFVETYLIERGEINVYRQPEGDAIGDYLMKVGRYNLSLQWVNDCINKFPLTAFAYGFKAKALILANRNNEANDVLVKSDLLFSDDQWYLREAAIAHFYLGNYSASKILVDKLNSNFSDRAPAHIWLDAVHAFHDKENGAAKKHLNELLQKHNEKASGSPAWFISMYYFFAKDVENGFKWLQTSYDRHEVEMTWLKEEPLLRPYRDHPTYQSLYEKMGWPKVVKN